MDIAPIMVGDIAEAQRIELGIPAATVGMQWKKYRPGNDAAHQADDRHHPQEPKEKISVQRRVAEDMAIGQLEERAEPIKETTWKLGAPFTGGGC